MPDESKMSSVEKEPKSLISRRSFLAVSGCAAAAIAAGQIVRKSEASLVMPPLKAALDTTDLEEKSVATSCLNCSGKCGIIVRVVNGKAVKITGNPMSVVSEGKTCPRAQIGLQVLYDEGRIETPLRRTNPVKARGVDPGWEPISWEQALQDVTGNLNRLRDSGEPQKLLVLNGLNSQSNDDMIYRFAEAYGTPNTIAEAEFENTAEKFGRWMGDGNHSEFSYDLSQTNYVLAFGANLLESETPLSSVLRDWGKMRRGRAVRGKAVIVDPRYSVTAAKADEWIPINPGTDAALAMGIANVIIQRGIYDTTFVEKYTSGFDQYKQLVLKDYNPQTVAEITGIDSSVIVHLAMEFAQTKPAVAWIGRGATGWPNGAYTCYAVHCLNALVGNLDVPGGVMYPEVPQYQKMPSVFEDEITKKGQATAKIDLAQATEAIISGKPYPVEIAIGFNTNFNMSAPGNEKWHQAMEKIPYYIHLSPFPSEMAQYADILLPTTTYLEEWGYEHNQYSSVEVRIKQPAVNNQHGATCIADIIFEMAHMMSENIKRSFDGIGDDSKGLVTYRTGELTSFQKFRETGVWSGSTYSYYKYGQILKTSTRKFEFQSENYKKMRRSGGVSGEQSHTYLPHYQPVEFLGNNAEYPLALVTYHPVMDIKNGGQNYPWAQEVYLVMHGRGWNNFVEVNSKTAGKYGFKDGDMVWVESSIGRLRVKARVLEGMHPDVAAVALGQGHYAYGEWQKGIGINPNDIIGADFDRVSGQAASFNTRVKIYKA